MDKLLRDTGALLVFQRCMQHYAEPAAPLFSMEILQIWEVDLILGNSLSRMGEGALLLS